MTIPRSHRPCLWYGHWHPTSKKWQKKKKKTVCETMVWPLMLKNPGLWDRGMVTDGPGGKPEHWHPSSIKTSRYWWRTDAGVKIVTFQIAANTMARNGSGQIQLFNFWRQRQEKKGEFAPLWKKPGLWDRGVATGGLGQKPARKKWPGLSDRGMASGGLS